MIFLSSFNGSAALKLTNVDILVHVFDELTANTIVDYRCFGVCHRYLEQGMTYLGIKGRLLLLFEEFEPTGYHDGEVIFLLFVFLVLKRIVNSDFLALDI